MPDNTSQVGLQRTYNLTPN